MLNLFAVDLNLNKLTVASIVISSIGFILMFGIASAKGGFQELISTTLENDATYRKQLGKKNKNS